MAQESIAKQSHGIVYSNTSQGGKNKISHLASKPGDAPNTDTGRLIQSLNVRQNENWYKVAHIEANAEYAAALELGAEPLSFTGRKMGGMVEIDDGAIDQAVLKAGDVVVMGRVRIEARHRG